MDLSSDLLSALFLRVFLRIVTATQSCTNESLGIEDGRITDDKMFAYSKLNNQSAGSYGRLNQPQGSWTPTSNNLDQWIQVVLLRQTPLTGIQTQGAPNADQWVTKYNVKTSLGIEVWSFITENNTPKVRVECFFYS